MRGLSRTYFPIELHWLALPSPQLPSQSAVRQVECLGSMESRRRLSSRREQGQPRASGVLQLERDGLWEAFGGTYLDRRRTGAGCALR
jgi:hypothetical protein